MLAVPKPVKELVVEAAELAGADVEAVVVAAEEELTLKLGNAAGKAAGAVVVLAAGVEALLKLNETLEELVEDEVVSDGIVVDAVEEVKL